MHPHRNCQKKELKSQNVYQLPTSVVLSWINTPHLIQVMHLTVLSGSKWFTASSKKQRYYQIAVQEEDKWKNSLYLPLRVLRRPVVIINNSIYHLVIKIEIVSLSVLINSQASLFWYQTHWMREETSLCAFVSTPVRAAIAEWSEWTLLSVTRFISLSLPVCVAQTDTEMHIVLKVSKRVWMMNWKKKNFSNRSAITLFGNFSALNKGEHISTD